MLVVLGLAAAYVAWHLDRGWVPLDEGSLSHAAQRVLLGELPHRDFDDVYTGGLAWLNAAAFRALGTTLWSMRLALFAAFVAWVPIVYNIASRFVRPPMAGAVTLLAVAWSVPNYPAPMPSWYNLFLACAGVACLLRFLEREQARWLFAAGLAGGMSFLVKVVGLYFVAGALLFLVFLSHAISQRRYGGTSTSPGYALFATTTLVLFVGALLAVVRTRLAAPELVQFVLPGAAVATLLIRNEWTLPAGPSHARFGELARLLAPFAIGVALPVAAFLVPYASSRSLGAFAHGVFVLPAKRLGHAAFPMPFASLAAMLPVVLAVLLALHPTVRRRITGIGGRQLRIAAIVAGALLASILYASGTTGSVYRAVLFALRGLLPVMSIVIVALVARDRDDAPDAIRRRAKLLLLLAVTAVCTLVQFPFTVAIYFCYVAPLVALTALALSTYRRRAVPVVFPALLVAFVTAFAVLRLNGSPLNDMDRQYEAYPEVRPVALERAGLRVPLYQAGQYEAAVRVVREHARGQYIWASPDAPQLYFLAGYRNPTRSLFEFFDDTTGRSERILRTLDQLDVNLVVLNLNPEFSPRISLPLYRELAKRYPNSALVEPYLIKWRD